MRAFFCVETPQPAGRPVAIGGVRSLVRKLARPRRVRRAKKGRSRQAIIDSQPTDPADDPCRSSKAVSGLPQNAKCPQ